MLAKNIGKDTENDKLYVNDKNNDNNIGNYDEHPYFSRWRSQIVVTFGLKKLWLLLIFKLV